MAKRKASARPDSTSRISVGHGALSRTGSAIVIQSPTDEARVLHALRDALAVRQFTHLRVMVAWLKERGLAQVLEDIERFLERGGSLNMLVGTDFGGTEPAAVRTLMNLQDAHPDAVEIQLVTMQNGATFHPKFYWFQGEREHRVIVGSSNFTRGGLVRNVEMITISSINATSKQGSTLLHELEETWAAIMKDGDEGAWAALDEPNDELLKKLERFNQRARKAQTVVGENPLKKVTRSKRSRDVSAVAPKGAPRLVMDIGYEQGQGRNQQVQPPKDVWLNYFGIKVPVSKASPPKLKLTDLRTKDRIPARPVVGHGHVTTIELTGAVRGDIVEFARKGKNEYAYKLHKPGETAHRKLDRFLKDFRPQGRQERRVWYDGMSLPPLRSKPKGRRG